MIRVSGLTARLDGRPVLRGVDMEVERNTVLLGPNGSGKSTLLRAVLGLVPYEGRVEVDGLEVRGIRARPGLVAANLAEIYYLVDLPVGRLMSLYMWLAGSDMGRAVELVEALGLRGVLGKKLWSLSSGEAKLVCNVMALAVGARHVLLDEPFENVDPARRKALIGLIGGVKGTVLLVTHELSVLRHLADWDLYFMAEGKVYGKARVGDLLDAHIAPGRVEGALFEVEVGGARLSIVKGSGGHRIGDFESLDKLYELA